MITFRGRRALPLFVTLFIIGFPDADRLGSVCAQSYQPYANLFEKRSLTKEGNTLPYRLMKPKNYDTAKRYPLHITLHGAPERGNNNESQVSTSSLCVAPWALDSERTARPAFVLAPQCPSGLEWISVHWSNCGAKLPPVSTMAWPGRFVLDLIDSLRAEFAAIDSNRIYISGGSMGGVGTWYLCQYKPGLFAAAFPICGSGDTTLPNAFVNLPLWTFAGTADNEVPYSATRAMIAAIKRAGGNPRYTEVAGEGHTNTLIGGAAQNRDVHVWLFNQTKATTSVHLSSARSCPKEATSTGHTGIFRMVTLNSPPGMPFQIDLMGRSVTIHNSTAHASGEKAPALYIADFQKLR